MNLKKFFIMLTTIGLALGVGLSDVLAQQTDTRRRVQAELGAAFLDYQGLTTGNLLEVNSFGPGINMGAHVYLNRFFNLTSGVLFAPDIMYPTGEGRDIRTSLLDLNALARFKVNGLYREDAIVAPFLAAGLGLNSASNNVRVYIPVSLGLQFQLTENFSLQFATTYKQGIGEGNIQHLAHSMSFVFGIPGTEPPRQRPQVVRPRPDTATQVASTGRYADSDGDGVPDRDDLCADVRGRALYLGCPTAGGEEETELAGESWPTEPAQELDLRNPFPGRQSESGLAEGQPTPTPSLDGPQKPFKPISTEDIERVQQAASRVYFSPGSAELTPESQQVLDEIADILKRYPDYHLQVTGYTDNMGSDANNTIIAIKRGFTVKKYFAYTHGIRYARIYSDGAGQDEENDDAAEQRRVEFRLIAPGQAGYRDSRR